MKNAFRDYGLFARRLVFTLLTLCIIAALIIQDHTDYLPLGVFNTGAETIARIADACLGLAVLALIVQFVELFTGRMLRLGGALRGAYVFLIILDVLLIFGDQVFVTGDPAGRLGQYYEVAGSGNPPVILKKHMGAMLVSPCPSEGDSTSADRRILFLGDSYTEGSGSSPECNYPDVTERVLRERWLAGAKVVNAGVSGYGPTEALGLLRWYRDRKCPLHAVVYNLTLQNDLADNPPRTERRVVAGIIFRFPRAPFLRVFHPLNTRVFRWALVLVFFGKASTQDMLNAVSVRGAPCDLTPAPLPVVSPFLRATVERDYRNMQRVLGTTGYSEAVRAIDEMRVIAHQLGVPFFLVVFPDRILADRELQDLMDIGAPEASARAHAIVMKLDADCVVDVYGQLSGRPGLYRTVDTHLSDLGNVVAGEHVGSALAECLELLAAE